MVKNAGTYTGRIKYNVLLSLKEGITIGETELYESHGVLGDRIFEISHTGMIYNGKKAMLEIFQDITERKKMRRSL